MTIRSRVEYGSAVWIACLLSVACSREASRETPNDHSEAVTTHASAASPAPAASQARVAHTREVERDCDRICLHSVELKCSHADECKSNCIAMGSIAACEREFSTFYRCLSTQPLAHFNCDEDGIAAIGEGFCDQEQQSAISCMDQNVHQ